MKWKTHKLVTAAAVLGITGNPIWTILAVMGSILPDSVEYGAYGSHVPYYKHRKLSHWPVLYAVLAVVTFILARHFPDFYVVNSLTISNLRQSGSFLQSRIAIFHILPAVIYWICIGALFHIAEDAITGTVPLLNPQKRNFGIRLVRTGSTGELILFFCFLLLFVYVVKWRLGI